MPSLSSRLNCMSSQSLSQDPQSTERCDAAAIEVKLGVPVILTIRMSAKVTKWRKRPGFIRDIHESSAPASIGICMARWNGRLEVWSRGVDGAEVLERLSLVSIADQSRQPCVCAADTHKTIPMRSTCGEISFHSTMTGGEYPS
mmetsp:Transcript_42671/g.62799  ORF Transcript_42671/g.62799 Transcript_42671/m.62799 type:complete len:144 (+) Transcript_42671:621-1052(+)